MAIGLLRRLGQKGQVLVLAGLVLPIVIGGVGLAIDVGFLLHTRTELQKDVDAMALAGARAPCGASSCETQARPMLPGGTENGVTVSDTKNIDFSQDCDGVDSSANDLMTARVTRNQKSYFAQV